MTAFQRQTRSLLFVAAHIHYNFNTMNISAKQTEADSALPDVGIVADDLTSAADGAGPFVERGLSCIVGRMGHPPAYGNVRSIDTGSRFLTDAEAARVTAAAIARLRAARILYKTIDSTLRGHLKMEIQAAFTTSQRKWLVIAPAFPDAGRTTAGGVQYVDDVPVSQTAYAYDPVHPAQTAHLAELVDASLGEPVIVNAGSQEGLGATLLSRHRILLVDARTQAALDRFVFEFPDIEDVLWVGSPGIARALASFIGINTSTAPERSPPHQPAHRALVAVGSLNPVSRRQLDTLQQHGVTVIEAGDTVSAQPAVIGIKTPDEIQPDAAAVLTDIAEHAAGLIDDKLVDVLIATGGATMEQILATLDVRTFELSGELEPGFPIGHARLTKSKRELLIALKAGGFGNKDTLLNAIRTLLQQSAQTPRQTRAISP